jgi:hypothetical protein
MHHIGKLRVLFQQNPGYTSSILEKSGRLQVGRRRAVPTYFATRAVGRLD